ncbi:MAG: hypothetical protein KAR20_19895, partial [Candidatus Heimdallarchaeota archaeon]|nr:hypothetical protein [Candidatus Heimdallarchaeota archaeon]
EKNHESADLVKPLKELALIKDQSYSFFFLAIDVYNDPFAANPTNNIGTRIKVPVESIRPHIMPRGERVVYQIGVRDSFIFVNPPGPLAPDPSYYPLPFCIRLSNFGDRVEYDFSLFPGANNTSQAIKTSMEFPQSFIEIEYGKNQGALPDTLPVGPVAQVFTKTDGRKLDPLIDYNAVVVNRPTQYLLSARVKFYIKTITLI